MLQCAMGPSEDTWRFALMVSEVRGRLVCAPSGVGSCGSLSSVEQGGGGHNRCEVIVVPPPLLAPKRCADATDDEQTQRIPEGSGIDAAARCHTQRGVALCLTQPTLWDTQELPVPRVRHVSIARQPGSPCRSVCIGRIWYWDLAEVGRWGGGGAGRVTRPERGSFGISARFSQRCSGFDIELVPPPSFLRGSLFGGP